MSSSLSASNQSMVGTTIDSSAPVQSSPSLALSSSSTVVVIPTTATNMSTTTGSTATMMIGSNSAAIKKRKVKFSVQLSIQELLSVPYLNGVLFCKVRLCEGGSYVSYSSKYEINFFKDFIINNKY